MIEEVNRLMYEMDITKEHAEEIINIYLECGNIDYRNWIKKQVSVFPDNEETWKIAKEAERFANNTTKTNTVLNEETSKITEIKMLAQSIDKMELETVNYINNLEKVTKENERVGTELKLA